MIRILQGDCRHVLRTIPDKSVHCIITSPPYFGLRDYGASEQIGLEPSPNAYVAELVGVFREIWRVLRDDGTAWLNLGDSYSGRGSVARRMKPKDLLMIPARVAIALQDDGWWVRSKIVWAKPNTLPESATDRPTSSYEEVFLLSKSGAATFWLHRDLPGVRRKPEPDYRWLDADHGDAESTAPPADWQEQRSAADPRRKRWRRVNLWRGCDYFYDGAAVREQIVEGDANPGLPGPAVGAHSGEALPAGLATQGVLLSEAGTRALRNVWTLPTKPFPGAHFAVFPEEIPTICIKAGTSQRGSCPHCKAPWARIVRKGRPDRAHQLACGADAGGGYRGLSTKGHDQAGVQNASDVKRRILEGLCERTYEWRPSCSCPEHKPVPCTVLDPFFGAGTTGLAADRLVRHCIGIEVNPAFAAMAERRLAGDAGFFADITRTACADSSVSVPC